MSVYVDDAYIPYGRMIMCHMMADTESELHEMAAAIGVARRHYQQRRYHHYDICKKMRAKAVELGAIECTSRELVAIFRKQLRGNSHGR